jgi:hypothetical protein
MNDTTDNWFGGNGIGYKINFLWIICDLGLVKAESVLKIRAQLYEYA